MPSLLLQIINIVLCLTSLSIYIVPTKAKADVCGFATDCDINYDLNELQESANERDLFNYKIRQNQVLSQTKALKECKMSSILNTGAWCLIKDMNTHLTKNLPGNNSYKYPKHHVAAEQSVVNFLIKLYDDDPNVTINDFGAGVGQYGHHLLAERPHARYIAYDGAGDIEQYTKGFVKRFDLTLDLSLPIADWVLSIEVGEHIPHEFEEKVIGNIHAHNRKGVILSWAALNQGGHGHVNNHSLEYLKRVFETLGYVYDAATSEKLRNEANWYWLKKTLQVYRRKV